MQITSTSNVEQILLKLKSRLISFRRGAELIGLPRILLLGEDDEKLRLASELSKRNFLNYVTKISSISFRRRVSAGDESHTFNRSALFGKDGQILAKYDKIHLFDVDLPDGNLYKESSTILSGGEYPPVVDVPGLCKIGLSIC